MPSIAVPASQKGGKMPPKSSARPPTSKAALRLDDLADVGRVALAEVGDHAFLERVEFAAERLGLLGSHRHGLACDGSSRWSCG